MSRVAEIEALFSGLGADFLLSAEELREQMQRVRAFVFDWDGVFNRGDKGAGSPSTFSEPDSMGTNLLRYAFWLERRQLPICAVVSGAHNESAQSFARREHFDAVYNGFRDKATAMDALAEAHSIERGNIAYVFDDANDFSAAETCALRFLVRRDSSPLLREYAVTAGLVDYVTAARSGEYAVREISELLIGLLGGYPGIFESRHHYDARYQQFFAARQLVTTGVFDAE